MGAALVGLAAAVLLLLLIVIVQTRRIGRLRRRLDVLTRGEDGRSLDAVLDAHLDKVLAVSRDLDALAARSAVQESAARRSVQRVALVRFNPFEDTGGNQSFALALLDGSGAGVVISSLHSRTGTRVYAKTIVDGRSNAPLSDEETEALRRALATPTERSLAGRDRVADSA